MATPEETARMTDGECLSTLSSAPASCTAAEVTEVSGRGVGMDVVQSVLHRSKASISVEDVSRKRHHLPHEAVVDARDQLPRCSGWSSCLYAIPLNAVMEISRTFETEVHQVDNYEVLQLRNQVLPLLRLGRPVAEADRKSKLFVLVITAGE